VAGKKQSNKKKKKYKKKGVGKVNSTIREIIEDANAFVSLFPLR